jgi:hypothetical protein
MFRLKADSEAAFDRFVLRSAKSGNVWYLRDTALDEPVSARSNEHERRHVFPFWSDRAYAAQARKQFGLEVEAVELSLQRLLEIWLPRMADESILFGANWDRDWAGSELEPKVVEAALGKAMLSMAP